MIRIFITFLVVLISTNALSKIEQNEPVRLIKDSYSYKEVCDYYNERDLLIIENKDLSHLDCMGKIVDVSEFCKKKGLESKDVEDGRRLLRGIIIPDIKSVQCERAEQLVFKYSCDASSTFCQSAYKGCRDLGKIFASELELLHSSILDGDKTRELNCLFGIEQAITDLKKDLAESI